MKCEGDDGIIGALFCGGGHLVYESDVCLVFGCVFLERGVFLGLLFLRIFSLKHTWGDFKDIIVIKIKSGLSLRRKKLKIKKLFVTI